MAKKPKTHSLSSSSSRSSHSSRSSFSTTSNTISTITIYLIFLVKQELNIRKEQFFAIKKTQSEAIEFCRNLNMNLYCKQNEKYSIHFTTKKKIKNREIELQIPTTYSSTQLLIKRIDFTRQDEGRSNNNPRWFFNIVEVTL